MPMNPSSELRINSKYLKITQDDLAKATSELKKIGYVSEDFKAFLSDNAEASIEHLKSLVGAPDFDDQMHLIFRLGAIDGPNGGKKFAEQACKSLCDRAAVAAADSVTLTGPAAIAAYAVIEGVRRECREECAKKF